MAEPCEDDEFEGHKGPRCFEFDLGMGAIAEGDESNDDPISSELAPDMLMEYTEVTFSIAWKTRSMKETPIIMAGSLKEPISMPRLLMSCSLAPPFVCFTIGKGRQLLLALKERPFFSVNYCNDDLKSEVHEAITQHYFDEKVDTEIDMFKESRLKIMRAQHIDAPVLSGCSCCFECKIDQMVETGDHMLVIACVLSSFISRTVRIKKAPKRTRRFSVAV